MVEFSLTNHARDVIAERDISENWVWSTIDEPDNVWHGEDGNTHYVKRIAERAGRYLHVVVNSHVNPQRIVTVFFDRRIKGLAADEVKG
jgi:hypothetical protein